MNEEEINFKKALKDIFIFWFGLLLILACIIIYCFYYHPKEAIKRFFHWYVRQMRK